MKLIVGLGNPGLRYRNSRHNIGSSVVKMLARAQRVALKKERGIPVLCTKAKFDGQSVLLATPLLYMNVSGEAVRALIEKYIIAPRDTLVVCDDLDLELGRIKLKSCGSSGGHRGLASIIEALDSGDFNRLRIGIGRPRFSDDAARYVLSNFTSAEKKKLKETMEEALSCVQSWVVAGSAETMNIFNRRGIKQ